MHHIFKRKKHFSLVVFLSFTAVLALVYLLKSRSILLFVNFNPSFREAVQNEEKIDQYPLTLVSAYFDISRKQRPKEEYLSWIKNTINLNAPFIFFTQSKHTTEIERIFKNSPHKNAHFKIVAIELEDLIYFNEVNLVKEIITSSVYKKRMSNSDRLECTNPLYSIVIHSKFMLLLNATRSNPFNSRRFVWVDAGISRFFNGFDLDTKLTGNSLSNSSFFITLDRAAYDDVDFLTRDENFVWTHKNFFLGGIMGGTPDSIVNVSNELRKKWKYLLDKRIVNNEQINLMLVYFERPNLFDLKEIALKDWNLKQVFDFLV
jgi:hypothetical protein